MIYKIRENIDRIFRSSYAEHSFWMMGGQGGQAAVAFFANLVLVRYLFPEDFGRFALVQASVGLAAATLSLRINVILLQASEGELQAEGKDKYVSALVGQTLLVCLGSLALLWLFALWNVWAMVLLLNVLIEPWIHAQRVLYERTFQYKNLSLVESGSHLVSHVFSVLGVVGGLGPAVLYLRGWVQILGLLGGLAYVGGLQGYHVRWLSMDEWRFVFRQVRGYWLEGWLAQSFERLVIMFLGLLEGQQMTGYFFQARRLAVTPSQLFDSVSNRVLFNFLSHRVSAVSGIQVLQKLMKLLLPFLVLIAAIAFIGADPFIPWIFGPGWEPVIPIFQGMVGVLIGMTPFNMLGIYFKAQNNMWPFIAFGQGFQYGALGLALLVVVLLKFPAVYGLAVGMSVGYLGGFLVLTIPLRLFLKERSRIKPDNSKNS
jgi:O-antigen/teichoic acid export membrane protein